VHAQIYSWTDADGRFVVSNVAPGANPGIASYQVPRSDTVRATEYVAPERSRFFDDLIDTYAERSGIRSDLVRAVIQVESAFNPHAVSNKGAMGLMQLMPATARQFGVRNAFDPDENVRGGVAYLRQLLDRYDGDERLALAAYNAGPGAVDRHGQTVPPFRETREYVSRVNRLAGERRAAPESSSGPTRIYRVVEVIDGREVVKYTDHPDDEP
jgi:soluble lytic murein transglycosylase-like protein